MKKEQTGDSDQNIKSLFENTLHYNIFTQRCHDTGDSATLENAKVFKEEFLKRNVKQQNIFNLQSMRLGINAVIALSNGIEG